MLLSFPIDRNPHSSPTTMKRKQPGYKRFRPVPHAVFEGSKPDTLESHIEVHRLSLGRLGGHTTYRKGPVVSSLLRCETEENPQAPAPLLADSGPTLLCDALPSSNGVRPAKVRAVQLCCKARSNDVYRLTHCVLGFRIVTNTCPKS